jgi:hypothetical protein
VKKMAFFWTSEGGNSFREYFLNKPGNLFLNFDILLGNIPKNNIYDIQKNSLTHSVLLYLEE